MYRKPTYRIKIKIFKVKWKQLTVITTWDQNDKINSLLRSTKRANTYRYFNDVTGTEDN